MAFFLLQRPRMLLGRHLTFFGLGLAFAGCSLGDTNGLSGGDDVQSLPANALCQASLTLTGTLVPEGTPPTPDLGCVPQGTWTVRVAVQSQGDCSAVPDLGPYVYTVTGEGHNETITYSGSGETQLQIHADDSDAAACEGSFEHIVMASGGQYNVIDLRPIGTASSQTIAGDGTFQLWSKHP